MEPLKKVNFIAVHHSQRKIDSIKRIRDLHIRINKWEDIGYHYLIDKKGKIHVGRSEKFIGAHVFGHNKNSIGICLIGNFDEEKQETNNRIQELRMRLQVIQAEAVKMVNSTQKLTEGIKIAVLQGTVDASEYQINFFENIIKMIANFRKKIDSAVTWLQGSNTRAQKKNFWSQYKKKGASFLLSGESYSQRSAG